MTAPPDSALDGLWTTAVAHAWLTSLGVPHRSDVPLGIGARYERGAQLVGMLFATTGPAGVGAAPIESRGRQPGFTLQFRGRRRLDEDLEGLAMAADRLIWRASLPAAVPSGGGSVRLLSVGWIGSGPQRVDPIVDPGERDLWSCSYYVNVIEEP